MATFQITSPDGNEYEINAPEGATQEDAMAYAQANYSEKSAEKEDKGFFDRVGERFEERSLQVSDTMESLVNEDIGAIQGGLQFAGKGVAGPVVDVLGEGIVSAAKGLSFVTPDVIEEPAVNAFKDGWNWLTETGVGEAAGDAIKGGVEEYGKFKENNPQAAKTLESVINVGLLLAPVKSKANASPTVLGKAAAATGKAASKQLAKNKSTFVQDLISPTKTKKVKEAEVARTVESGVGPFKRSIITPTTREAEVASEVLKIKGVSQSKSVQQNYNAVNNANTKLAKRLESNVSKERAKIPLPEISKSIDDAVNILIEESPLIVGNIQTTAKRVADKAKKLIASNPQTASGLLRSRKQFDTWVRGLPRGESKLSADAAMESQSLTIKAVRNAMNDMLDSKVKNTVVKRELKRQSLLYEALENMTPKAASEYNTALGRAWQNSVKVLPTKNKLVQQLAVIFGIGGLGAAAKFAPIITGVGGGIIGLTLAGKALRSPKTKIVAAKLIKAVDKAILSSKNPSMVKQLRADRALIVNTLKNSQEENE